MGERSKSTKSAVIHTLEVIDRTEERGVDVELSREQLLDVDLDANCRE